MSIKISCLTATHGRFSVLRVAVACFLAQQNLKPREAELIILNNHPTSFMCNLPMVSVFNEPKYKTLGDCRNRLLELASGEFVRTWDDDDLFLPWTISQGLGMIGNAPAFKPARSWSAKGYHDYTLDDNVYEAAMTVRTDVARKYKYKGESGGDEHETLLKGLEQEGGCFKAEMGWRSSYAYNWATPLWRISGSLGSAPVDLRTAQWVQRNQDHGGGKALTPDEQGMRLQFKALVAGAKASLGDDVKYLRGALADFL